MRAKFTFNAEVAAICQPSCWAPSWGLCPCPVRGFVRCWPCWHRDCVLCWGIPRKGRKKGSESSLDASALSMVAKRKGICRLHLQSPRLPKMGRDDDGDDDEWRCKTCMFSVLWTARSWLAGWCTKCSSNTEMKLIQAVVFPGCQFVRESCTKAGLYQPVMYFGGFRSSISIGTSVQPNMPGVCNSW